jgi:hypothetical protein
MVPRRPFASWRVLAALTIATAAWPLLAAAAPGGVQVAPAPAPACGNGLLEATETCDTCAADCAVAACKGTPSRHRFEISLIEPPGKTPLSATLRVAYRSTVLSLPGRGSDTAVRKRVTSSLSGAVVSPNDLGYAAVVVVSSGEDLAASPLLRIEFDGCEGSPPPTAADLSCAVLACAGSGGPIDGCGCNVAQR